MKKKKLKKCKHDFITIVKDFDSIFDAFNESLDGDKATILVKGDGSLITLVSIKCNKCGEIKSYNYFKGLF